MRGTVRGVALCGAFVILCAAGCGKKGYPLPPLRPLPARIADVSALRVDDRIELSLTVPAANMDGTTPVAIDRIDIYALTTATLAPPSASVLMDNPKNLRQQVMVRSPERAAATPTAGAAAATRAGVAATAAAREPSLPGDAVTVTQPVESRVPALSTTMYFVAVPVSGKGRGRPGPPSAVVGVPIVALPMTPQNVAITQTETEVVLTWETAAARQRFRVFEVPRLPGPSTPRLLTPAPLSTSEFRQPVEFGRERCFVVRALEGAGAATSQSAATPTMCITPVDRYPPPAPTGLQALQEGAAVTLVWTGVEAADLAGYIVLRSEGATVNLQPMMREPVLLSTFADTNVRPGVAYLYAILALDKAGNFSAQSNRETVTVR